MKQVCTTLVTLRYCHHHPDRVLAHVFTNSRSALGENPPAAAMKEAARRLKDLEQLEAGV